MPRADNEQRRGSAGGNGGMPRGGEGRRAPAKPTVGRYCERPPLSQRRTDTSPPGNPFRQFRARGRYVSSAKGPFSGPGRSPGAGRRAREARRALYFHCRAQRVPGVVAPGRLRPSVDVRRGSDSSCELLIPVRSWPHKTPKTLHRILSHDNMRPSMTHRCPSMQQPHTDLQIFEFKSRR